MFRSNIENEQYSESTDFGIDITLPFGDSPSQTSPDSETGADTTSSNLADPNQEAPYVPEKKLTLTIQDESSEREGITRATVGRGTIIVADDSDLSGLNRDVNNFEEVGEEITTGALDATVTIDLRILSSEGRAAMMQEQVNLPENIKGIITGIAAIPGIVGDFLSPLFGVNDEVITTEPNGVTPEDELEHVVPETPPTTNNGSENEPMVADGGNNEGETEPTTPEPANDNVAADETAVDDTPNIYEDSYCPVVLDGEEGDGDGSTITSDTMVTKAGVDGKVNDDGVSVSAEAGVSLLEIEADYNTKINGEIDANAKAELSVSNLNGEINGEFTIGNNEINANAEFTMKATLAEGEASGSATFPVFGYDITVNGSISGTVGIGATGEFNASFNGTTGDFGFGAKGKITPGAGFGLGFGVSGTRRSSSAPSNSNSSGNTNNTGVKKEEE